MSNSPYTTETCDCGERLYADTGRCYNCWLNSPDYCRSDPEFMHDCEEADYRNFLDELLPRDLR